MLGPPSTLLRRIPFERRMKLYHRALGLHTAGLGIHRIERQLRKEYGYSVAAKNISRWIYHGARPDTRANVPSLEPSPQLSYFLGAFRGDGYDYYDPEKRIYRVGFRVKDMDFLSSAATAIASVVNRIPRRGWTAQGVVGTNDTFHIFTVDSWSLRVLLRGSKSTMLSLALKFPIDFLRGIFDAEGFVSVTRDGKRLRVYVGFGMSDRRLVGVIQRTLFELGIHATGPYLKKATPRLVQGHFANFKRDVFKIHISSLNDLQAFSEKIGFTIKRKKDPLQEALMLIQTVGPERALVVWTRRHKRGGTP